MKKSQDFVIGRDTVLAELEPLSDLLGSLVHKAQFGPKNLVGHVWDKTREHGVKKLFNTLKERVQENTKSIPIEYTCVDVSFDAIVLGTSIGVIFLYDRTCRKLSRLPSEVTHEPARCIKLLPTHSYTAVGFNSGLVTIFAFVLASQGFGKPQTLLVSGAHNSPVTCLEWSPDGELLYTGDALGTVFVTVSNFHKGLTQTAMMFQEASPIVQLSYSWEALLISSEKRTVLWNFSNEQITQIGQKERKSPGRFGALFYPPAKGTADGKSKGSLEIYTSRPGLRLWTADVNGKVSATLMYKGLTNENPPGITTLDPPPPCLTKLPKDSQVQFGPLRLYHGQFFVTWDVSRLWVLDTSPCALVGYHGNLGDIVDVSTVGHEIYVLQRGGERLLMKLSLIPKLANPLLDVVALLERSLKEDEEDGAKPHLESTVQHKELKSAEEIPDGEKVSKLPLCETEPSIAEIEAETESAAPQPDPFKKYQEIRHQDFGEIVFRKNKKSKKKANKGADPSQRTADQAHGDIEDQLAENNTLSGHPDLPLPPDPEQNRSAVVHPPDPALNRYSNISSDFDSGDRLSGENQDSEGEDGDTCTSPHLMVVHVTKEGAQEKHEVHDDVSYSSCVTKEDVRSQNDSVTIQDSCVTEGELAVDFEGNVTSLENADTCGTSLSSANISDETLSPDNSLCMDSVSLSTSTMVEDGAVIEDSTLSPEDSLSADYLQDIYSNTPVNFSDATFSDASVEKSSRSKTRLGNTSGLGSASSLKEGSDVPMDSEGTPPVYLDSEGAEELSDTASWSLYLSRRTMSDAEIVNHEDAPVLEGSFSSTGSGSSLSKSPGSTKEGLRLLADSWADYTPPGQGYVQFVAVSDTHIWCITTHENIFYCPTHYSVVNWTQLGGSARMIAVNNTGDVIWSVDRRNYANARFGVSKNHLTGKKWQPVEKEMRYVAVDETAVWGIKLNGDVFVRTNVSKECPTGKGWRTIRVDSRFTQVSCFGGVAWFLDRENFIHVYKGDVHSNPGGNENWETLNDVSAKWVCLGIQGVAWIVDTKGCIWFTNVTSENPMGGTWYQVSLGQYLMQNRTLLETLWSWVLRDDVKLLTASPKAGVWLLGSVGSLQASHGHLLGARWDPVIPQGIAQSVFWSHLSTGSCKGDKGHVWALQPNGELICFQLGNRPVTVEPPRGKVLKLISASGSSLWGVTHNFKVVQRSGISDAYPQGVSWLESRLSLFGVGKVLHLSCGALSTWAVDDAGNVFLRIGKEDSSDPSVTQAWIPVEGAPLCGCRFAKIAVSPSDRVVWAVDDRNNVYARHNVTPSFPIGTAWEVVPGTGVRDVAISEHMVWAICPNGDIVCRYGVSEDNCLGHYWKKVPGNFELISVTPDDELWAIDQNGQLFLRKTQHFYGTQSPFRPRTYSAIFSGEEDWEFI
ncbi:tectonin beta-propeller repeat-containing protein 2-like [Stylophora pistillata]|uniref:Tectonin beta-propeller repeat-containing protein 2 n=1 Tax=Stylophora pistillata TaxID=50429 RepID=A0A2B4RNH0_STYPI|nr:tectonin beta-propeller repeat-containing protein 2-like [Stylophora pistillata]PFX19161.1 Tectonin beta-propeller repeat-containing protein 2 [Stylophora pistillata]